MEHPSIEALQEKACLSVHEAAMLLASDEGGQRAAELRLAHAIDHGDLRANICRWATEQWQGDGLPGNIDRMRTFVDRVDLDAWLARQPPLA